MRGTSTTSANSSGRGLRRTGNPSKTAGGHQPSTGGSGIDYGPMSRPELSFFSACRSVPGRAGSRWPDHDWRAHGADSGHTQYSSLDQIDAGNVSQLKVAWTYHAGDMREGRSQIQCNPLVVHGVLYATSPQLKVFALDAATGARKWVFDPFTVGRRQSARSASTAGSCSGRRATDQRIPGRLRSAPLRAGREDRHADPVIRRQGQRQTCKDGLGRDASKPLCPLEHARRDLQGPADPGHPRVRGPGPFLAGPRPRATTCAPARSAGSSTPSRGRASSATTRGRADAYTRVGGANAWSGISVDQARGLVFLPTGSAAFDFWGGNRTGREPASPTACSC